MAFRLTPTTNSKDFPKFFDPAQDKERNKASLGLQLSGFKVKKKYYSVQDGNYEEARKNVLVQAQTAVKVKTSDGSVAAGLTEMELLPRRYVITVRYSKSNRVVWSHPVNVPLRIEFTVTLPTWNIPALTNPQWGEFIYNLERHEQLHVCMAVKAYKTMMQRVRATTGNGKTEAEAYAELVKKIQQVVNDFAVKLEQQQKQYDDETDSGRNEQRQRQYNTQIDDACEGYYRKDYK